MPHVSILALGGTIASRPSGGRLAQPELSADDLAALLGDAPGLAPLRAEPLLQAPSGDLTFAAIAAVAQRVREVVAGGALGMMIVGLSLMGLTYGPLGTVVSELFPTPVRYSGSSLAFNFAGILGASLAPYIATWLATHYGLPYVGYYLSASAVLSFVGLLMIRETKDDDIGAGE